MTMLRTMSIKKINFYFAYEFGDTLKSFNLFLSVKTIRNLNLGQSNKSVIKIIHFSHRGSNLHTTQNLVI